MLGLLKRGLRRVVARVLWRQVAYNELNVAVLERLEQRITALGRHLEHARAEREPRRAIVAAETWDQVRSRRFKVAFVVQRYGTEICGGSEQLCRQVGERMARHWEVEVLTTCATDHMTWENVYPPGPSVVNGVTVRSFRVDAQRDPSRFFAFSNRVLTAPHSPADERRWMAAQGPCSTAFEDYVLAHQDDWDFVVFFTYLYALTFHGLPPLGHKAALVHRNRRAADLPRSLPRDLRGSALLLFLTPQEQTFVNRRFGTADAPQDAVPAGIDPPRDATAERFRQKLLGARDFILYAGRNRREQGLRDALPALHALPRGVPRAAPEARPERRALSH